MLHWFKISILGTGSEKFHSIMSIVYVSLLCVGSLDRKLMKIIVVAH